MLAHVDHGPDGTGEQVAALLRPGNAGSNTAADHITTLDLALAQIPVHLRDPDTGGRVAVLVRTDSGGASLDFTHHIHRLGMEFSVGASLHNFDVHPALAALTDTGWQPAIEPGGRLREGAWVAEATDLVDLTTWPPGTRLILRKERPHPGAQLRITDTDGNRVTGFLTTTRQGEITALELRHRQRARQEDRIRNAKDTGLRNLPFHDTAKNRIWMLLCALAGDLIAWTQRLALTDKHRIAEPKRLRLRIFSVAAILVRTPPPNPAAHLQRLALGHRDHHRPPPPGRTGNALTFPSAPAIEEPGAPADTAERADTAAHPAASAHQHPHRTPQDHHHKIVKS